MKTPLGLTAWRMLSRLASPLAPLWLARRTARGKETRARLGERLGQATVPRPAGRLIWVHGASVGETEGTMYNQAGANLLSFFNRMKSKYG